MSVVSVYTSISSINVCAVLVFIYISSINVCAVLVFIYISSISVYDGVSVFTHDNYIGPARVGSVFVFICDT